MNVFTLRDGVLQDYHRFVESFLNIQDSRIRNFVGEELAKGALWPEPLVQLNPSYEMGKKINELVTEGVLHPLCEKIFQKNGKPFSLYHHQEQAIRAAAKREPYILTTGTGSGKSLTYLIPIIDHILKNNPEPEQVRAIIVYPMNALINSQTQEIERLLNNLGEGKSPIRFGRYTGQEKGEERTYLQTHPPHILLTNYMMLEYMMSRPAERVFLDRTLSKLEFFILDELHTYTGRQGADVSMLVRRVRQRCGNQNILCIGTSATMVAGGTRDKQQEAVARVAGTIFGVPVSQENVIDERLKRSIEYDGELTPQTLKDELKEDISQDTQSFIKNPLAAWIEETFGIQKEGDYYRRKTPITLRQGAELLSEFTESDISVCEDKIRAMLHKGSMLRKADDSPAFAVRLHQFISQGDSVYSTFESAETRHLTMRGQRFAGEENGRERLMAPLRFCRICGQEYYHVTCNAKDSLILPRMPEHSDDFEEETHVDGYLLIERDENNPVWDEAREAELPQNWMRETKKGFVLNKKYQPFVPKRMYLLPDGHFSSKPEGGGILGWFFQAPFLLCLSCGIVYDKRTQEFTKLAPLSTEGRSSSTTILASSIVSRLRTEANVPPEARKILSFTDNRQDASLQAGHFNDFLQVGLLRSGIYAALPGEGVLKYSSVADAVFSALNLSQAEYAKNPGDIGIQPKRNREVFTEYLEYRIYHDLRRGWRIVQPNLEQCGLLRIEYEELENVCTQDEYWKGDRILAEASAENRVRVARAFLNHLRHSLALDARCLQATHQIQLKKKVQQTLKEPWTFDDDEILAEGRWFVYGDRDPGESSLSPISVIGKYLRSPRAWGFRRGGSQRPPEKLLNSDEYDSLLRNLVDVLHRAGYLDMQSDNEKFRIQLQVNSFLWVKGDGSLPEPDPVRLVRIGTADEGKFVREGNRFFIDFYTNISARLASPEGREHTGQTSREDRESREEAFREGKLSCLFCSPTMELGIDIADLNSVNMRNVPPTPANYAQRSGRAGRSGQPAFMTTFCTKASGHDQYFFRRQPEMVAGVVVPPRLDLSNENLMKSHMHAVWLSKVNLDLENSVAILLDLSDIKDLPLSDNIKNQIDLSENRIKECIEDCKNVIDQCRDELENAPWFSDEWLERVVRSAAKEFDNSFDRWRGLYKIAYRQAKDANDKLINAHHRLSTEDRRKEEQREREARRQLDLLRNEVKNRDDSDFYPYRYLAAEGFLPGYNFPTLPVRAYIPRDYTNGVFISRGRHLALAEYGPRNIIYHEGRKYRVVRSLLPVVTPEDRFRKVKLCSVCGAFYEKDKISIDTCDHCRSALDANNSEYLTRLFEMTTVSTQRADRITCNEEERLRRGYEVTYHLRFAQDDGKYRKIIAQAAGKDSAPLLKLIYGPAADLWFINRGWRRGRETGFKLDLSNGFWNRKQYDTQDTALDGGETNIEQGVSIFVRETGNVLLVQPGQTNSLNEQSLANLQYAILKGICAAFHVDQSELSSGRIGKGEFRSILLVETAEGGLGVLRRFVEEPDAMSRVAIKALEMCHINPESGEELEDGHECVRACYDCLLTYYNQPDHHLLDRNVIKDILMQLVHGSIRKAHEGRTYEEHYEWLRRQTDNRSKLEKDFLDFLYRNALRLPDQAQKFIKDYPACPDFYYDDGYVCVFCDGSVHDTPKQREEGEQIRGDLMNKGYRIAVIRYDRPMQDQIKENRDIFGEMIGENI